MLAAKWKIRVAFPVILLNAFGSADIEKNLFEKIIQSTYEKPRTLEIQSSFYRQIIFNVRVHVNIFLFSDQLMTVRISALRAIRGFCEHLRSPQQQQLFQPNNGAAGDGPQHQQQQQQHLMRRSSSAEYRASLLQPVLPAALDALVAMSAAYSHSSDMLGLILENMAVVLDVSFFFKSLLPDRNRYILFLVRSKLHGIA